MKKIFYYKDLERINNLKNKFFNKDIHKIKIDMTSLQFEFISLILYDNKGNFCYIEYHFNMRNKAINKRDRQKIWNFKHIVKFTADHNNLLNSGVK